MIHHSKRPTPVRLRYGAVLFFVLFVLVVVFVVFLIKTKHITITADGLDGTPIHCYLTDPQLTLKWRHSVEKQYWQEYYEQHGDRLHLTRTYMQAFGAGTPVAGDAIDAPAGYVGLGVDQWYDELNWAVSHNMRGEIELPTHTIAIYQYLADYTPVRIRIESHAPFGWWQMDKCQGEFQ